MIRPDKHDDALLAEIRPNGSSWTSHYVHQDGLGSVRTITDVNGNLVDARSYEAFGTRNAETGSDPLPYAFAGEAFDSTTNLAYHRARWMDSRVGRFTGMDVASGYISAPVTLHRYLYAGNEPVAVTDPTGNDLEADEGYGNILAALTPGSTLYLSAGVSPLPNPLMRRAVPDGGAP